MAVDQKMVHPSLLAKRARAMDRGAVLRIVQDDVKYMDQNAKQEPDNGDEVWVADPDVWGNLVLAKQAELVSSDYDHPALKAGAKKKAPPPQPVKKVVTPAAAGDNKPPAKKTVAEKAAATWADIPDISDESRKVLLEKGAALSPATVTDVELAEVLKSTAKAAFVRNAITAYFEDAEPK